MTLCFQIASGGWSAPGAGIGVGFPINGEQRVILRFKGTRPGLPGKEMAELSLPAKSGMSNTVTYKY